MKINDSTKKFLTKALYYIGAVLLVSMALGYWKTFVVLAMVGAALVFFANEVKPKSKVAWWAICCVVIALLYANLMYPAIDTYMRAHWRGTWGALQMQMTASDLAYARKHSVAGNAVHAVEQSNAEVLDAAAGKILAAETKTFVEKVARGEEPSSADSLVYLNAQLKAMRKTQVHQTLMAGGLLKSPIMASGTVTNGNHVLLEVDVANPEGKTFEIPAGMTAEVSIDSAWYTCKFAEIAGFESRWCDGDGYGIASKKTRSNAEIANRFRNRDEAMGAVLVFDEKNPQGYRLAMGATITVTGSFVTLVVNDWVGGWFGGEHGAFTGSKMIRRGGFFDNRGYLRVLIVLNP